jgi:hypothetical protein
MIDVRTIDQMIERLEELKAEFGGDTRVLLKTYGRELLVPHVMKAATGKSDEWKLVSRGGVPCVVICE